MIDKIREALFRASLFLSVIVFLLAVFLNVGPWVQMKYFPVFGPYHIDSAVRMGSMVRIEVSFTKNYLCDRGGYAWYAGKRGDPKAREIAVHLLTDRGEQSSVRPPGPAKPDPFDLEISPEDFNAGIFGDVYSNCPLIPWLSKSEVYPDPKQWVRPRVDVTR